MFGSITENREVGGSQSLPLLFFFSSHLTTFTSETKFPSHDKCRRPIIKIVHLTNQE